MLRALGPRSLIIVPLVARGRTIGMIWLAQAQSGRHYDADDLSFAEELARRAAASIDHSLLHRETKDARREAERRAQQETALRQATGAVSSAFTTEDVMSSSVLQNARSKRPTPTAHWCSASTLRTAKSRSRLWRVNRS